MGKVLIATFDDEDEMALDELLLFLKSKKYIRFINTFSNDNYLKYDNLVIDSKYRIVETGGESIELTNYEFEILDKKTGKLITTVKSDKSMLNVKLPDGIYTLKLKKRCV